MFPALPSVVALGARQRKFFFKIKKVFADGICQGRSAQDFFKKNRKTIFVDGLFHGLSAQHFFLKKMEFCLCRRPASGSRHECSKKYKNLPLCRWPGREAVGKEDFKKPSS
jgi:hypothetical protein